MSRALRRFGAPVIALALAACADAEPAPPPPTIAAPTIAPGPAPPDPIEERNVALRASRARTAASEAERRRILAEAVARAERIAAAAAEKLARPVAIPADVWAALARCESGGNPRAVGGGGRYFGAFQFTPAAWRDGGGTGHPLDHDYGTQLAVAQRLQAKRGWGQWPHCSRRLGLR